MRNNCKPISCNRCITLLRYVGSREAVSEETHRVHGNSLELLFNFAVNIKLL